MAIMFNSSIEVISLEKTTTKDFPSERALSDRWQIGIYRKEALKHMLVRISLKNE